MSFKNDLQISLVPIGVGTVSVQFEIGNKRIMFEYTIMCEPISELINSYLKIENGKSHYEEVCFSNEPGEVKLQLIKIDKKKIQVSLYKNDHAIHGRYVSEVSNQKGKNAVELKDLNVFHYKHLLSLWISQSDFRQYLIDAVNNFQRILIERGMTYPDTTLYSPIDKRAFNRLLKPDK